MQRPLDPRNCNSAIDANALDSDGSARDQLVERLLELARTGTITLLVPKGVRVELQHPNTPTPVQEAGLSQIFTIKTELTAHVLEWALRQEMKGTHARENLVQRMCLAYLWSNETLESPRFALLFDARHAHDLEVACSWFWAIRGEPLSNDHKERILLFWSQCVTWTKASAPPPGKLLSALSLLACYLKSVESRELQLLLAVTPHVSIDHNADFFIEELGRLVDVSPSQVGEVLDALLSTYRPSFDFEDRLKDLVTKLAAQPETRSHALRSADRLRYIPGMVQIYAQISDR